MYLSIDIESDGPCPGLNSMLSLGAAAFDEKTLKLVDTFEANLHELGDAEPNPGTMAWWKTQPEAWAAARVDAMSPITVIHSFDDWLKRLPRGEDEKLLAVCYPASFDFPFVKYYCERFMDSCPLGFQAIDIRSYAMGAFGATWRETSQDRLPPAYRLGKPLDHRAVSDAIAQGEMFMRMLAFVQSRGLRGDR